MRLIERTIPHIATALLFAALLWPARPALADFTQNGPKLVGSVAGGSAQQGFSVALSADGHTAIVGGPTDINNAGGGAAWVFTRTGEMWTQQGNKLVGTGAVGTAVQQGRSVALSADGNTAIVGGPFDNSNTGSNTGAAWVFMRTDGVWTPQGDKLVGTGAVGAAEQGSSVALSPDGKSAIVGGPLDNGNVGAAWVFTRTGGVWTQQRNKLVGPGAVGSGAQQGRSVALSADGNTAIVGGVGDSGNKGAAWVFTRTGSVWTPQGNKLVGPGAVGAADQGSSVALSPDGKSAIVGGPADDSGVGAAWVFLRDQVGGAWTQQGSKLVGTGAVESAQQGTSVGLSCNAAVVGGRGDDSHIGASWVFAAPLTGSDC
jgi:hypothetical protein